MAFTTPDTAVTGAVAPASMWNTGVRDNMMSTLHPLGRKTADQTVNNSAVLVDATGMSFAVEANDVWLVHGWLMVDSTAAADIKFGWTVPASTTMRWGATASDDPNVTSWGPTATTSSPTALAIESGSLNFGALAGASILGMSLTAIITVAGTAGTVQFRFAQAAATAVNTILKQNSCLVGMRLT